MFSSKKWVALFIILCSFFLVYGTAIIGNFLFGHYYFEGGILESNYIAWTIACAAPFFIYLILVTNDLRLIAKVISLSFLLFSSVFIPVHFTLTDQLLPFDALALFVIYFFFPFFALCMLTIAHHSLKR